MGKVTPYLIAAVEFYTGNYYAGWLTLAAAVAGTYEQHRQAQQARKAYNDSLQDRLLTIRSGISTRQYVLGEVRVAGTLMYADTVGNNREALDMVLAFAGNRCELLAYYLNEDRIDVDDFPGTDNKYGKIQLIQRIDTFTVSGPSATITLSETPSSAVPIVVTWQQGSTSGTATGVLSAGKTLDITGLPSGSVSGAVTYRYGTAEKLHAIFLEGTPDQAGTAWFSTEYDSESWTLEHRLQGICGLRTLLTWDETIWASGAPNFTLALRGKEVEGHPFYDPRIDNTLAYTRNPAILAAWFMTLDRLRGGCGIPSDWIDWASVAVAANICDEKITVSNGQGGYEQVIRYECNTILDTAKAPEDNLATILSSMAGRKCFTAGKYRVVAGAFRPAIVTITDADVVGDRPISVMTANATQPPPNIVTATFVEAASQWRETSPRQVVNQTYITRDGHEARRDMRLDATTDARQAHYLMGVQLETERPAFGATLSVGGIGEDLAVYDCVQLNLSNRAGYAGRTFEILGIIDHWDGTFDLTLAEIKPTAWALDPDSFTPSFPESLPDLDYLWNVAPLSGFQVASVSPTELPDGTAVTKVELVWLAHPGQGVAQGGRIEIRYREASSDQWVNVPALLGDSTGTTITAHLNNGAIYLFQARAVNSIGAASDWVDAWQQIEGDPLPVPKSIRLRATSTIIRVASSGDAEPNSITLSLDRRGGLTGPVTWSTSPSGVPLTGSGDTRTLSVAALFYDSVRIDAQVVDGSVTYEDTLTIVKVYDGADASPDLTPPPQPTGLQALSLLFHIQLQWTPPTYTVGHGHRSTVIYAAPVPASGPQPTFANAVEIGSSEVNVWAHDVGTGQTYAYWIKFRSNDGVLSAVPAGGINGVQATSGRIGNVDLNDLIITAQKLADGSITPAKVAAGAIDATKFANNIQPVTIVSSVPTTLSTRAIFNITDQKLYHWNGSAYTASVPANDVAPGLTSAQIADLDAAKLTGTIAATRIADGSISTPKLAAGSVTSAQIAADTITAANIAAGAVTASELSAGAVTTAKLAAGAVTANELAAGSVVAGKVAAGAISTNELAAGAVTTAKLLVVGQGAALNADPTGVDSTAWASSVGTQQFNVDSSLSPNGKVLRSNGNAQFGARPFFPAVAGKRYRLSFWARQVSGSGPFYARIYQRDAVGNLLAYDTGIEGITLSGTFTRYVGYATGVVGAVQTSLEFWTSYTSVGVVDMADIRCEEVIPGELIVDGAITASKLSANAIAVGTAAIQNGAIVNAMLGNAIIDEAKIVNGAITNAKLANASVDSAKIQDAAINNAKIANLAVDTLKIQGNAVTVASQASRGPVTVPSGVEFLDVLSLVIATSGAPVKVDAVVHGGHRLQILRDGGVIYDSAIQISSLFSEVVVVPVLGFAMDFPPAGAHTYTIRIIQPRWLVCDFSSIVALETKK